jgi:hypothetical protein
LACSSRKGDQTASRRFASEMCPGAGLIAAQYKRTQPTHTKDTQLGHIDHTFAAAARLGPWRLDKHVLHRSAVPHESDGIQLGCRQAGRQAGRQAWPGRLCAQCERVLAQQPLLHTTGSMRRRCAACWHQGFRQVQKAVHTAVHMAVHGAVQKRLPVSRPSRCLSFFWKCSSSSEDSASRPLDLQQQQPQKQRQQVKGRLASSQAATGSAQPCR